MRRLMFITLMAALWAWGGASQAAMYRWKQTGAPVDDYRHFYTDSPACSDVASKWERIGPTLHALSDGSNPNTAYTYAFSCSFVGLPVVGSTVTVDIHIPGVALANSTLELVQIIEDSPSSEVSAMPVQRVLVLLGGALMLGLGVGVGRIR